LAWTFVHSVHILRCSIAGGTRALRIAALCYSGAILLRHLGLQARQIPLPLVDAVDARLSGFID